MKAIVQEEYGPPEVLRVHTLDKPEAGDGEVLIGLKAASVNFGDLLARDFKSVTPRSFHMLALFWFFAKLYFGWRKPKFGTLGSEFSGRIEATGEGVTEFAVGDEVFGYRGQEMGAYAEYLAMPEKGVLTTKPDGVSFEEAAAIPYGGLVAYGLLKKVALKEGQRVLINGASGSIGAAALQIARARGAEVTAVCSTRRMEYVRSLGAHHVIDYTTEDFTQNGQTYDLILDVLGKSSFKRAKHSLAEGGTYLLASFKVRQLLQMLWTSVAGKKKVKCVLAPCSREDLLAVRSLVEEGRLRAILDRTFPLEEASQAHAYVESGQKEAAVVIALSP